MSKPSALGEDLGFLVPHDGDKEEPYRNLRLKVIREDYFLTIPAKHVLLIIDACYAGLALRDVTDKPPPSLDERVIKDFTRPDRKVRQVLAAGSKDQKVLDGGLFGHSIFTGRLIEALRDHNSFIIADTLADHVRRWVPRDAKDRNHTQTPQFGYLHGGEGTFVFCREASTALGEETGVEGKSHGGTSGLAFEVCPRCGLRNSVGETFRCRICGQDYLCRAHDVAMERCCEEWYDGEQKYRVLRGAPWIIDSSDVLLSSYRHFDLPGSRHVGLGFRVVSVAVSAR